MSRNTLYVIIALLAAGVIAFGVYTYQQQSQRAGIEIEVNEQGLSIETY